MPPVVAAFRQMFREPDADAAFKSLLNSATTAGKLYALCGIYYTDPAYFEKAVSRFLHSNQQVQTYFGCMVSSERVADIVQKSGPHVVRLKNRKQTIQEWSEETKAKGVALDITGGGWPCVFKGE